MRFSTVLAAVAGGLATASPVTKRQNGPSGHEVEIQAISYGGTGCPDNSVQGIISDDLTTMTLTFDAYTVQSGPDIPATERRKFCQLQMKLKYPSGFQYSIFSADYRGYASLSEGVTGTCTSTYYFSGQTDQVSLPSTFEGPIDDNYLKHDEVDAGTTVWSPCGEQGMLNIKSEVRLSPFTSEAVNLLTVDTVDTKFTQKYYMQWQPCPEGSGSSSSSPGWTDIGRFIS